MYRFVLRPRWILSHLLALSIVVSCIVAGLWQLERRDARRDINDRVAFRSELPVLPITTLLSTTSSEDEVDDVELRVVEVTGTYQLDDQVTVANRSYEGAPGYWVLTPVLTTDGMGVVVNRGWVPLTVGEGERIVDAAPPSGEVRIIGSVSASQQRGTFGAIDSTEGRLTRLARADIGRMAAQLEYPVLPAYVTLADQAPQQQGSLPVIVEVADLGEGPHLGYAFQWFTFGTIAAFGYPMVLRKVGRERAAETPGDARPKRRSQVPVDD